MQTLVKTPQAIFNMPQRLLVPLFQRPYVWNEENQWDPLWRDIERTADRVVANPEANHVPHFLGAIVLQQLQIPAGDLQVRTIIDGQQRLTTLQILLDAIHAELTEVGATRAAERIIEIVQNRASYCDSPDDHFKVWPTNRDRDAYREVMDAQPPIDYSALTFHEERLQKCHRFFAEMSRSWLMAEGASHIRARGDALEKSVRELLQLVVIDLDFDENAQEIFETLNSRGAPLSAADLIKNFIFQRLLEQGADTEAAYEKYWKRFESKFWEAEVSSGRLTYPRSSVFLNAFLVSRLGEPITALEVFSRFKTFARHESGIEMIELLEQIDRAATVYESYLKGANKTDSEVAAVELFAYRIQTMETDTLTPVILTLLDPELAPIPDDELLAVLGHLESYVVRRMLVRGTTKNFNRMFANLVAELRKGGREQAGTFVETFLAEQVADASYWPDDDEIRRIVPSMPAYRRYRRPRLRMILEAIEDHRRGYSPSTVKTLMGQRCPRGALTIEHVLPQAWEGTWVLNAGESKFDRDSRVHVLGNLTLLTGRLNAKVSNGPWLGDDEAGGKRSGLAENSSLRITADVVQHEQSWTVADIDKRTSAMVDDIIEIWKVPEGHSVNVQVDPSRIESASIYIPDLINLGVLSPGTRLVAAHRDYPQDEAMVLPDGRIELADGTVWGSPSGACWHHSGNKRRNGWTYWAESSSRRTLREIRREYLDQFDLDDDDVEIELD